MKVFKSILLTILVVFGSLNPSVYADCCQYESDTPACCRPDKHAESICTLEIPEEKNCHETGKNHRDGYDHFSCCTHLPVQVLNEFTPPTQERHVSPLTTDAAPQAFIAFLAPQNTETKRPNFPACSGLQSQPPGWIAFRNIRC